MRGEDPRNHGAGTSGLHGSEKHFRNPDPFPRIPRKPFRDATSRTWQQGKNVTAQSESGIPFVSITASCPVGIRL
jgi:hypothetical protein